MSTCDVAKLDALVAALAEVPAEQRVAAAATGWPGVCPGDAILAGQVAQIPTSSPANWWLVELQTGLVEAHVWPKACAGGTLALSMATKLDAGQRRAHLWKECGLEGLGAFDAEEWGKATGLLVVPILAAWTLSDAGVDAAKARPLIRALAGVE